MVERVDRRRFESRNATARNLKGGWDGRGQMTVNGVNGI